MTTSGASDRRDSKTGYIGGVDIGGTFTDCVVVGGEGTLTLGKALCTPGDFSAGAVSAVADAAKNLGLPSEEELIRSAEVFFHACTVGENTLITRSGAKTGLIATRGFGDALLMMRGKVTDGLSEEEAAHLSALSNPEPIVPRHWIEEVRERVDYKGRVVVHLDEAEVERAISTLVSKGVESVAIALLWSIANNYHEAGIADILKRRYPSVFFTLSSHVAPFLGEYERTATTVFNAYIGPKISSYLRELENTLRTTRLRRVPLIMQAYGGVLGIGATCRNAVGTIKSGPASGVVGSRFLGSLILATDMGGTTFKVSVIHGGAVEREYRPVILCHSIV